MIAVAPWCFGAVSQVAQTGLMALALAGLAMWWFSMAFGARSSQFFPSLAVPLILGIVLVGIQMVPLSNELAKVVAPRQLELYQTYGSPAEGELLVDPNRPQQVPTRITMDVDGTAKMFNLMMLALICLVLTSQLFSSRRVIYLFPLVMTINGIAISLYGIVQRLKSDSTIFGYVIEYAEQPFGPFVNKNNAAGYLLLCMAGSLALLFGVYHRRMASGQRPRAIITNEYPIWKQISLHLGLFFAELNASKLAALLATLIIFVGILFTVSRGGILAMGCGSAVAAIYFCFLRKSSFVLVSIICLVLLSIGVMGYSGLGDRIARRMQTLSETDLLSNDQRVNHWIQTAPAIGEFSPLGSGVGSYLNVHRLYRLDNEKRVFYFAENQYFQTLVEAGVPGLVLLLAAIVLVGLAIRFLAIRGNSPKTSAVCLMGMFLLPSQVLAAAFDFGLFIPANCLLMAGLCGLIAGQKSALANRLKRKRNPELPIFRFFGLSLLLLVFGVSLFCMMSLYRFAAVERNMGSNPQQEFYLSLGLPETEQRIEDLKAALQVQPDSRGLRRLAELYLYRYRIQLFDILVTQRSEDMELDELATAEMKDQVWNLATGIDRLHGMIYQAWASDSPQRVAMLIEDPLVKQNLLPATHYLKLARARSPLEPSNHLLLAQLHAVSPVRDADQTHLQRSQQLAPANSITALICGILDLQAGRTESACESLKRCLQIDPRNYGRVMAVSVPFLPAERIERDILPENPFLLHSFANVYMNSESKEPLKLALYERVENLLEKDQRWDRKSLKIKSEVEEELGKLDEAIETQSLAKDMFPLVSSIRERLALLLKAAALQAKANGDSDIADRRLLEANRVVTDLLLQDQDNKYKRLYQEIKALLENSVKSDEDKP